MIPERLDVVVFGATGFTGKYVVFEISKFARWDRLLTWGVAGRTESKLRSIVQEASLVCLEDLQFIPLIVADVNDYQSLKNMCEQARVVINCCGPYRMYGEPVVKAAIESGTHYIDVSGEPQFIETMQLKYHEAAKEAGVFVISACGFDSIPNDMGVVYMQQKFDGVLNSVESYLSAKAPPLTEEGLVHYGTWESLVYSLAHYSELRPLRKKLYQNPLPTFKPQLRSRGVHSRFGQWNVPFLGADKSIVYRTQRALYEEEQIRPVQFRPYVVIGGFFAMLGSLVFGAALFLMSMWDYTRNMLLEKHKFFSWGWVTHEGPSIEILEQTSFRMELRGEGWARGEDPANTPPTKKIAVRVSGKNPGYGVTALCMLYAAVNILRQRKRMPAHGGVLTTGAAFRNTDLVKNLTDNDVVFEVVDDTKDK